MQYQSATGQTIIVRPLTVEDFKKNPEVRSARRTLLILASIRLVIVAIHFIISFVPSERVRISSDRAFSHPANDVSIVFIIIGGIVLAIAIIHLISVIQYWRIGILILAWFYFVTLIIGIIAIVLIIFSSRIKQFDFGASAIDYIQTGLNILLLVLIIAYSFKLAAQIRTQKAFQIVTFREYNKIKSQPASANYASTNSNSIITLHAQQSASQVLLFACLTLIQLVSGFILLILAIMAIIVSLSLINIVGSDIIVDMILIIVASSVIILSILIILSSSNLIKLIKH